MFDISKENSIMISTDYAVKALINRQKRLNQVKFYKIVLIIFLVFLIVVFILLISFSTKANNRVYEPSYKYYKSIEITKGDTLWSVANEYFDPIYYKNISEYVKEVKEMNDLTSDDIIVGSHIIIPYYILEEKQE